MLPRSPSREESGGSQQHEGLTRMMSCQQYRKSLGFTHFKHCLVAVLPGCLQKVASLRGRPFLAVAQTKEVCLHA